MGPQTASPVTPASVVAQCPGQVAATIDEVTAIMSVDKAVYFLMDATGSVIWGRMAEPTRVSDLCAALVTEYEVDPAACERDVLAFLDDLLARGLARIAA
jgi:hypothetical protein